jgi:hypothetical protein
MPEGRLKRTREAYGSEQPPTGRCCCGAMPGEPHAPECYNVKRWYTFNAEGRHVPMEHQPEMPGEPHAPECFWNRSDVKQAIGIEEPTAETPWAI